MFGIQNMLIAAGIALLVGTLGGGYTAWHYTKNHYEARIAKERDIAQQEVIQSQSKLIAQERINAQTISKISQAKQDSDKAVDDLYIRNVSLASKLGGLYVSGTCQAASGVAPSASSEPISEAGQCKLSDEATGVLLAETRRADTLGSYVETCFAYVQKIEEQRSRMQNDQKDDRR